MPFAKLQVLEGKELVTSYDVKAIDAVRCFCSRCGTRLYNHSPSKGMISLAVATLDTDAEIRPLAHINIESKRSWSRINDELPRFSSVPNPSELGRLLSSTPSL